MFNHSKATFQPGVTRTLRKWRVAMKRGVSFSWFLAHCSARGDKASKHSWLISELILQTDVKENKLQSTTNTYFMTSRWNSAAPDGRTSNVLYDKWLPTKYWRSTCYSVNIKHELDLNTTDSGRIRGHSQLQREHEALEELLRQLWDLFRKDLTDEGDELVVLITQRRELDENEERFVNTDYKRGNVHMCISVIHRLNTLVILPWADPETWAEEQYWLRREPHLLLILFDWRPAFPGLGFETLHLEQKKQNRLFCKQKA